MYKRVKVQNFRGLRDLSIEDLGRVNLIVGENNVGKTSLLEALWLLQNAGNPIQSVSFGETRGNRFASLTASINRPFLFHNLARDEPISIVVTEDNGLNTSLRLEPSGGQAYWYRQTADNVGGPSALRETQEPYTTNAAAMGFPHGVFISAHRETSLDDLATHFVLANEAKQLDHLVRDLRVFLPTLRGLTLDYGPEWQGSPVIVADVGLPQPLPLPLLGDGTAHLLELLLAVNMAAGGAVLIDEVEIGLHHRNFTAMWEALDRASSARNTQLFATTHSWECISAALAVFADDHQEDFRLHRLEKDDDDAIRAITLTSAQASAALDLSLEVR